MTEQIKITQEELSSLLDLREKIRKNVETVGRLNIRRHFVESELNQILESLNQSYGTSDELASEETRAVQEMTSKYGEGDLDFGTGIYTPKRN